jgi:hypothetical protein
VPRNKTIFILIAVALVATAIVGYALLPKRYTIGRQLVQTNIFWNDKEAFFFLNTTSITRSSNFLLDKLGKTRYGYLAILLDGRSQFNEPAISAYRLLPTGEFESLPLPGGVATNGKWTLEDGKIALLTTETEYNHQNGFRWDGAKFISVPPIREPESAAGESAKLSPDDSEEGDDANDESPQSYSCKPFKEAGWHCKNLISGMTRSANSTLDINLGKSSFTLAITGFPKVQGETFPIDWLAFGTKSMAISRSDQPGKSQMLWSQNGWQTISKAEFQMRAHGTGLSSHIPVSLLFWLVFFVLLMLGRFGSWLHIFLSFFGLKRRVLNNMASSYSFPPASPAQFPLLDTAALDRYTREFESMGFVRLLDFSLVSNSSKPIPNFCRVFVHSRHHCFCEVSQIFQQGKAPTPLGCSIQSVLRDGWTLAFADRKPRAAASLLRRSKSLVILKPGITTSALLEAFLQMRNTVCLDLGISPATDDTIEAYMAKVQRSAADMREAVQGKSFATAIPHVFYRKLSLRKTKEEYVWLGDYPKESERRKQGFTSQAPAL